MTVEAIPDPAAEEASPFLAGLFGRGLLYVAVTSLPILTATVVSPFLAHILGPAEFGLLAVAISLHQVLMAVAVFGVDQALILVRAETGGDRSPRVLITAGTLLALSLSVVVGATVALWGDLLGFGSEQTLAEVTVWWTLPTTFLVLSLALLMAQDRLRAYAVVSILLSVGSQVLGLALVLLPGAQTATVFAWGGIAGRVLAVVACLFLIRPRWFSRGDGSVARGAFALGLPIMLGSLSMFVLNSGDRLVVQRILGSVEVGRYQVAYTIGFEAITVFAYTGQAWAARFAEIRDDALRWRLLGRARDHLYEMLGPTLLAVNLIAPLALRIFAPASFRPEGLLLTVLVVTFSGVPTVAVLGSTRALIIQHRTRPIAVAAAVAAAVNVVLNIVLVPVIGLVGAAAATAVAYTVQAVILRLAFRPLRGWPRTPARVVVLLLATSAAATVFALVDQSPVWIAVRAGLAGLCGIWVIIVYLRGRSAHLEGEGRRPAQASEVGSPAGADGDGPASRKPIARLTSRRVHWSTSVSGSDSSTSER